MKIQVPQGMQTAFVQAMQDRFGSVPGGTAVGLEAALCWLSENPMVPTDTVTDLAVQDFDESPATGTFARWWAEEWQRRMFLAPEPEVPEEIKDLLYNEHDTSPPFERHNNLVIEAFRRGKNSR